MANDNDLIRRGDLKELLLKRSFFPAIVAAALKEIPAIATDNNVGSKWIPVTERLPISAIDGSGLSQNVIVHTIEDEVTTGWLDGSGHDVWWLVVGDDDHHTKHERAYVTHWMKLPKEPKEDAE
jgi:hypothetical protein